MHKAVGNNGLVIGIDPDLYNIAKAQKIIDKNNLNIKLIQKATYGNKGKAKLLLAKNVSHNRLDTISFSDSELFNDKKIEVELDTLDNIIEELGIQAKNISHVNITNNGAEYETLKGMTDILTQSKDLSITVIAGRAGEIGIINGKPDNEVICEYLNNLGFRTKFYGLKQLFWGGFVTCVLIRHIWIYSHKRAMGVVFAIKKNKRFKFYQSFS